MLAIVMFAYMLISGNEVLNEIIKSLPQSVLENLGIEEGFNNTNDFFKSDYFNSSYVFLLTVTIIVLVRRLFGKPLEDTSLSFFLNSQVSRVTFLKSQIVVQNSIISFLGFVSILVGVTLGSILYGTEEFKIM